MAFRPAPTPRPSFARSEGGTAAVEFALVSLPFITLCVGFLQFALLLYTQQTLSDALLSSASSPETELTAGNRATYVKTVCAKIHGGTDCATALKVELMRLDDLPTTQTAITGTTFSAGSAGDVMVLRAQIATPQIVGFIPQFSAMDSVIFRRP